MPAKRNGSAKPSSPALKHLYEKYVQGDAEREAVYAEHLANAQIARELCLMREQAGLAQRELAEIVGTSASAICRLEDADYEGHSLSMLRRVATALNQRVEVHFVPMRKDADAM